MASKSAGKKPQSSGPRGDGASTRASSSVSSHSRSSGSGTSTPGKNKSAKSRPKTQDSPKKSSGISLEKVDAPSDDPFTIDLTDPEDLLKKMNMLDLTEDETEDLIKQAYNINRRLKKELQERDMPEQLSRYYTITAPGGLSRSNTTLGSSLPPLKHADGKSTKAATSYAQLKSKEYSFTAESRSAKSTGSARGREKSAKRPEWNERFSFT